METKQSISPANFGMLTGLLKSVGRIRSWIIMSAGVLAFAGLMTTGMGISNADPEQVGGDYASEGECQEAGPHAMATMPGSWTKFWCIPDPTGRTGTIWRLILGN
jgi:ABC-type xylose transport system permease subunit